MIIDQEILQGFCNETQALLDELFSLTEEETAPEQLERYGQVIDRIMGAAYTLELNEIGRFCELGKKIGYKASQSNDDKLITLCGPILADTAEILKAMVDGLQAPDLNPPRETLEVFGTRLKWFLDKFQDIKRESTGS